MLLHELKKIVEIDTRISDMHRELADLYVERSNIVEAGQAVSANNWDSRAAVEPKQGSGQEQWAREQYSKLKSVWQCYDINLPDFKQMRTKLAKAYGVQAELAAAMPELKGTMQVVAIPPSKLLGFPVSAALRNRQGFSDGQDYINHDLPRPAATRNWRVLVAYADDTGLSFGLPKDIIATKKYLIAGYDTRALGSAEYAALSLQYDQPIDDGTWTLLLKGYKKGGFVPSTSFTDGRFRFELDEADSGLDIDLYRPAVEI